MRSRLHGPRAAAVLLLLLALSTPSVHAGTLPAGPASPVNSQLGAALGIGTPAFHFLSTCQPDSYISYGYGATPTAACHDAATAANNACLSATDSSCCTVTVCEGCVGGTNNFSCWLYYTLMKPRN